jgi:hypothetical protein
MEGIGELFSEIFSNFDGKLERITLSKSLFVTISLFSGKASNDFLGLILPDC